MLFNREKKYYLSLNQDEYRLCIECLIDLKNNLIKQGKYTDAVDDILIKLLNSKAKKVNIYNLIKMKKPLLRVN